MRKMSGLLGLLGLASAACGDNGVQMPDAAVAVPDALPALRCDDATIQADLGAVPGVSKVVRKTCPRNVVGACFEFDFLQPVQHEASLAAPGATPGTTFQQHINLTHRGCSRPTVVADWGYDSFGFYESELGPDYNANAMSIEHRFQGTSIPAVDQWDWTALTVRNGADDLHAVITAFRRLYQHNWVSTGASKGGITALYHRYFFQADVDGTVAYVAPASRSRADDEYQAYMKRTLPVACAQRMRDFQAATLTTRRSMLLTKLGAGFSAVDLENEMTYWDWGFWQYDSVTSCDDIPTAASTDDEFAAYALANLLGSQRRVPAAATDPRSDGALSYEWLTEQGFALQVNDTVAPLLSGPTPTLEGYFKFSYSDVTLPPFNAALNEIVRTFVRNHAEHLVLVYGQNDPWSGGALDVPEQRTSGRFFVADGNHGSEISMLAGAEQSRAQTLVTAMMGQPPVANVMRRSVAAPSPIFQAIAEREAALQRRWRRALGVGR